MRGAQIQTVIICLLIGIIPADAGSTGQAHSSPGAGEDHPRGCGEHVGCSGGIVGMKGSSPRMRGAPGCAPAEWAGPGIIPADAGSTKHRCWICKITKDHPRGCGEHDLTLCRPDFELGSSPRMRGARGVGIDRAVLPGIIPADAGSTHRHESFHGKTWDHPRGCGEHSYPIDKLMLDEGSSPRMRGALHAAPGPVRRSGIIPADAGSTRYIIHDCFTDWDHPRGCGEHFSTDDFVRFQGGSSPRMRGAQSSRASSSGVMRIIPADAGSTLYGDRC